MSSEITQPTGLPQNCHPMTLNAIKQASKKNILPIVLSYGYYL